MNDGLAHPCHLVDRAVAPVDFSAAVVEGPIGIRTALAYSTDYVGVAGVGRGGCIAAHQAPVQIVGKLSNGEDVYPTAEPTAAGHVEFLVPILFRRQAQLELDFRKKSSLCLVKFGQTGGRIGGNFFD